MSLSANRLFYTNTNHNDASNTLINFHNLTGNAELNEHPLSKYARGIFFSPNYNKEFFDAINWANNLGDYKTQLNLINPFVNNVLMNIGLLNDNVVLSDQLIISHILQMGTPIDGEGQSGGGGQSVSCNGDGTIVAIGAHYNNGHAGSVRVYDYVKGRVPKEWEQLGDDIEAESGGNYSGWSVSLSNDGKIVAIGAYGNSDKGNRSGHVRVYDYVKDRVPKEWEQLGSDIDGNAGGEDFGKSVSLSADGTIVAIGGQGYSNFSFMGVVRIYQWNVSDWDQLGDDIYGESNGDWSGWSVSLNDGGTIVAIGAHFHDGKGHVRVYDYVKDRVPKEWDQLGSDIDAQASGEQFGWSVSLNSDGTIIAIGGRGHNSSTGVVRVFKYNGNIWEIIGTFDGESTSDELGRGVSLSSDGTILAIGAPHNGNKGQARIYQYLEGVYASDWIQVGYDIDGESTSDEFGHAVSLSKNGSVLHVSAPKYNNSNGRVYTYELVKNPITSVVKMGTPIDGQGTHDHCGYAVSSNADGTIIAISSHWYSYTDQSNYLRGRVRIYKWNNTSWNHIGTIDGEDKNSNSGFSTSLSDDGTILAIGAPYNDGGGTGYGAGHVRVYDYIEGRSPEWDQLGSDIEGEAAYNFGGGSVSLNSNGTILAIGAKYNDVNTGDTNDNTGHVRVYEWNGINWDQLGDDIDGEAYYDLFGGSISLSADGTIVAIGAERNVGNGETHSGHVRIYDYVKGRSPKEWDQIGSDINGKNYSAWFGSSVSLSSNGNIVAIGGIYGQNDNNLYVGSVGVYQNINNNWEQMGTDMYGDTSDDFFGQSVSLSADGTILAIGANGNDGPANISSIGQVRVYQYVSGLYAGDWIKIGNDLYGEAIADEFGYSVSLSKNGSVLVVGAYSHDANNVSNTGRAYTYKLIEQPSIKSIVKMGEPINGEAEQDSFGYAVACNADGTVFAAAAPFNDDNGTNSGHVRVYKYFNPNDAVDNYNDHKYFGVIPTSSSTNTYWATYSLKIIQSGINIVHMDPNNTNELTFEINAHATGYWGFQYGLISVWCNTDTPLWYVKTDATIDGSPLIFELIHNAEYDTPLSGNFVSASSPNGPWVVRNSWLLNPPLTSVSAKAQSGPGYIITSDLNKKWQKLGQDLDGEAEQDRSGESSESISLNADGTIVAIGAILNDGNTNYMHDNRGHVRIYKWNGNIWDRLGDDINGEANNDNSGWSVSLNDDGTIVAIGARYNAGNGSYHSGHVRVYDYDVNRNPQWDQIGSDINGEPDDKCGWSVSLSSDGFKLAVGTANSDGINNLNTNSGHVTVYDYVKNRNPEWKRIGDDIYGEGEQGDRDNFGTSVSLSADGTIVASGAKFNDDNGSNSGHVRVYKYNGSSWNQLGSTIVGEGAGDQSGRRISLSADGTILAIGAHDNDGVPGVNSGHVRVYQYIEDNDWVQIGYDIDGEAGNYQAGWGLSLSKNGSVLVVGELYNNANGTNSGRVFAYEIV